MGWSTYIIFDAYKMRKHRIDANKKTSSVSTLFFELVKIYSIRVDMNILNISLFVFFPSRHFAWNEQSEAQKN